jgi:transposase
MRRLDHVPLTREIRNAYSILVEKLKEHKLLERRKYRSEDNIKTGLQELRCDDVNWNNLVLHTD